MYSATKNSAKRMLEYSTLKPATSSDSASGMSKGVRLTSASMPMKNRMNASGCVTMFHTCACDATMVESLIEPASMTTPTVESTIGTS